MTATLWRNSDDLSNPRAVLYLWRISADILSSISARAFFVALRSDALEMSQRGIVP